LLRLNDPFCPTPHPDSAHFRSGSWHRQRTSSPASGAAIVRHASWPGSDWFDVWTRESPSSADILLSDDEIEEMRVLAGVPQWGRSEEHTSELQSREDLVCRLLL